MMKIRVVSSKDEINTLDPEEKIVHLAFRPSNQDIFSLVMRCPKIKAIHIPSSYIRTISSSARMYLKMQAIELLEGDVWGHRKDINEYYEISQRVFDHIKQYKSEGMPEVDLVEKLRRETKMSPELISFLAKNVS
ncbi:Protein of unknown function (DUF1699) [Methanomethylovorans hollandica DSM 15978]|jgi:hypothetical protein|uniref:DUF1699 family protein n=2 Tax=Methanomethylovorans hollandica TaxID=101192 RepID=L0KWW8_METHD|nr:Protein of unknown function (DUF1699) [Methanomethylovorans hollandica DSM 15978]